ncbi:MAG: hypothetical protein RIT25_383 [Planctomycetota bacterium]
MDRSTAILAALAAYLVAMLLLGMRARSRTHDSGEFFLGNKSLGPWVTSLAANTSSSSAWSLVGVSGFAYLSGWSALWLLPGCIGGFLVNWLLVAPRLRAQTGSAITLSEFLAGDRPGPGRTAVLWLASLLTLGSLLTYVAAQMQAAGAAFVHAFGWDLTGSVLLGAGLVLAYTLMGGYLAACLTDSVQGAMMALVAVAVPVAAVSAAGGLGEVLTAIDASTVPGYADAFGGRSGLAAAGFALGLCGIGLGYPGQPHAVNKYMGMSPTASMTVARTVGIGWALILYVGMLLVGWTGRMLVDLAPGSHEEVLYATTDALFPPFMAGLVIAAVLAAIMSTVDSQLLVCASTISHDLGIGRGNERQMLRNARLVVLAIGIGATWAGITVPKNIFDNVLFAWAALGSAFGPLLLVRLLVGPVGPWWSLAAMAGGGGAAILGSYHEVWARGFADRTLSWLLALALALTGAWIYRRRSSLLMRPR